MKTLRGNKQATFGWLMAGLSVLVTGVLTLTPSASSVPTLICGFCGPRASGEAIANGFLYAPMGFGMGLAGVGTGIGLVLGLALSGAIELMQLVIPGRQTSLGDLLANGGGTLAGLRLAVAATRHIALEERPAGLACFSLGVLGSTVMASTAILQTPFVPAGDLWSQWNPQLGHFETYDGRLLAASVGTSTLPAGRVKETLRIRERLAEGHQLSLKAEVGPEGRHLAKLWGLSAQGHGEVTLLGIDRHDIVYRYRTLGAELRFDRPNLRLPDALATFQQGDTITVTIRTGNEGTCIGVNGTATCGLGFTVADGWSTVLFSSKLPPRYQSLLSLLWVGGLFALVGFFFSSNRWSMLGIALPTAAVFIVPKVSSLLVTPWSEWRAVAAGFLSGLIVSRFSAHRFAAITRTRQDSPLSGLGRFP